MPESERRSDFPQSRASSGTVSTLADAEADLLSIGDYTIRTWGEDQAVRYLEALEASCQTLADHPALGRACDNIRPGLRRMEHGRHVIFYRQVAGGVLVSRILHRRMLPERQHVSDDE